MSIPTDLLNTTCDVYRPFGAGSPTATSVPCRLVADFVGGRAINSVGLTWTHYLELDPAADVRDACTRFAGSTQLSYADGDEVRVPTGAATPRFAVVWVETVNPGTSRAFKRAYLVRDTA